MGEVKQIKCRNFSARVFVILNKHSFCTTFCKLIDYRKTKVDSVARSDEVHDGISF